MDTHQTPSSGSAEKTVYNRTKYSKDILSKAKDNLKQGNTSEAISLLQRVEDCEPEATFLMGVVYFDGLGVDEDVERGIEYMLKMSEMENLLLTEEDLQSHARYNLGLLYFQGISLPKDDDLAERYWLKAAKMRINPKTNKSHGGSLKSQTALGMFYSHPDREDLEKSYFWHSKACRHGSCQSEGALGAMYLYGIGVSEDPICAYGHLLNASLSGNIYAQGHLTAFYYLRQMYHRAVEMGKMLCDYAIDSREVESEFDRGNADQGVALGHFYLALCYQSGQGTDIDSKKAKQLIQKAIELCPTLVSNLHVAAILETNTNENF